ncbi:MAG: cytochrome P450 [Erythrobacter sp.]|nr:cytochrome P450 [Erythrobacter sp.]
MNNDAGLRPRDGFERARAGDGVLVHEVDGERIPLILRHKDVRAAIRDWETFSSDAPFRVPIPSEENVRSVRQIPIELDPPQHSAFRKLLDPWFLRPTKPDYVARIETLVETMLDRARRAGEVEIVSEFALPLQSHALAILLEMPQTEAERWIQWGNSMYREGDGATKGRQLETYISEQLERARANEEADDFFAFLTRLELDDQPLDHETLSGIANLTFAGGRDTVINAISEIVAQLVHNPADARAIADDPGLVNVAVEEFVRFTSPLSFIGRVCPAETDILGCSVPPDGRVGLCFASANHDETVFDQPNVFRIDRRPNPHVGFGGGKHVCLGSAHARSLLRALVERLSPMAHKVTLLEELPASERIGDSSRRLGYRRLMARLS